VAVKINIIKRENVVSILKGKLRRYGHQQNKKKKKTRRMEKPEEGNVKIFNNKPIIIHKM